MSETVLIVPDTHRPFHDVKAWALFMRCARQLQPKHLVIIGDFADCYAVNEHAKDPDMVSIFQEEIDDVMNGLDQLDALGARHKYYIEGNHEDRIARYVSKHPELKGVLTTQRLFKLTERGWHFTPYKQHTNIGKVWFTHDVGVASRTAIFRSLDLYQHSVVTGHTHRLMYVVEGTALGNEPKVAASFGWLGDVERIDYMHRAKARASWALGFGVGTYNPKTGFMYLTPVPILPDYSCCINGTVYR